MALITPFDPWASKICSCPKKYSLSPYTGCSHRCLYCYITSYIPDPFNARPKKDFIKRLSREMPRVDRGPPIIISSSSDPYSALEGKFSLTRATLKILRGWSAKFLLVTKSDLIIRDLDILRGASAAVSVTITTLDDEIAKRLEPSAPPPDKRLRAVEILINAGVQCSVRIDPMILGINSEDEQLSSLVETLAAIGVKHVTASTYKAKPDNYRRLIKAFPELEESLRKNYWTMGESIAGARYMRMELRLELIKRVKHLAEAKRMKFASCREGFSSYNSSASCDSTHLISILESEPAVSIRSCA